MEIISSVFFRRTKAFDDAKNVFFCALKRPSGLIEFFSFLRELYRIIRQEKPDAVVTFQHYGNLIGAPLARLAGVPLIIANQVSTAQHMSKPIQVADLLIGLGGAYDRIVVNSAATLAAYAFYPSRYRKRLIRIDHGFFDKSIQLESSVARSLLGLPLGVSLFGCAARLHPLKQLDLAIQTLTLNADHHFTIAGQGPQFADLQALAEQLGVRERLHFLGELDTEGMGKFLAALDCFVFPSGSESFGLAPVEAAQAGLPVVANDLPVLREVLTVEGKACALFVDAHDTSAFAAAILKVFDDEDFAQELSSRGRKLKNRFPLERMVEQYVGLLERH